MSKIFSEDAYCLGLLYAYIYANKTRVLKSDLDKFHKMMEFNLRDININDIYATVWYDNDPSIYFISKEKSDETYYNLIPNFSLDRVKLKYIECLSNEVLIASQKENTLATIGIKKEQILKNTPPQLVLKKQRK